MGNVQKGIERCLWAIGLLALAVWIGVWLNARHQQAEGDRELERRKKKTKLTKRKMEVN